MSKFPAAEFPCSEVLGQSEVGGEAVLDNLVLFKIKSAPEQEKQGCDGRVEKKPNKTNKKELPWGDIGCLVGSSKGRKSSWNCGHSWDTADPAGTLQIPWDVPGRAGSAFLHLWGWHGDVRPGSSGVWGCAALTQGRVLSHPKIDCPGSSAGTRTALSQRVRARLAGPGRRALGSILWDLGSIPWDPSPGIHPSPGIWDPCPWDLSLS